MGSIADKLQYTADAKSSIRSAIVDKGVDCPGTAPFGEYCDYIEQISGGGGGGGGGFASKYEFDVSVAYAQEQILVNVGAYLMHDGAREFDVYADGELLGTLKTDVASDSSAYEVLGLITALDEGPHVIKVASVDGTSSFYVDTVYLSAAATYYGIEALPSSMTTNSNNW